MLTVDLQRRPDVDDGLVSLLFPFKGEIPATFGDCLDGGVLFWETATVRE